MCVVAVKWFMPPHKQLEEEDFLILLEHTQTLQSVEIKEELISLIMLLSGFHIIVEEYRKAKEMDCIHFIDYMPLQM